MNLWLRLIWLLLTASRRPPLTLPGSMSVLHFRVWLHDLDLSLHMNNGRYLTLMDLGRLDMMLGSGLLRAAVRHRWTPIASAITIRYRRELRPFQKFRLETRLINWDKTLVVIEQTFFIDAGHRDGQVAARALFKGGLYDRNTKTFVPMTRLMEIIGVMAESPAPTPEVEAFLKADAELRHGGQGGHNGQSGQSGLPPSSR